MASADYDRHLQRLRVRLAEQRRRTAAVIGSRFPPETRFSQPPGGLALWVELPPQVSSWRLFDRALAAGLLVAPGLMFSNSNRYDHFVRLNCGMPYTPEVDAALKELGAMVCELAMAA